ncbi:tryptophan synthase subunit alpha [Brevibacillus sp. SYSU BS000544]|uniref:tryptophan synthase subunit alpha n=1 Tax=Brevibacillus sp. SYSU BS000544 TaxID=3416443 RepID=UPI003CE52507
MIASQNRIDQLFLDRTKKRFIPFITVGDPTLEISERIVEALVEAGADLIELGIPYSDPLADGPVIQRASGRALAAQVTLPKVLAFIKNLRNKGITTPFVLFSYYNPILQYGVERLFADLAEAGADGAVIPDLPYEENEEALAAAKRYGAHLISLVAPTSETRVAKISSKASGFIYCVSSLGVTGVRSEFHNNVLPFINQVRSHSEVPVAVGFGISTPEQVREFAGYADGVIVGSAIVQQVEANLPLLLDKATREEGLGKIKTFVQNLAGALK